MPGQPDVTTSGAIATAGVTPLIALPVPAASSVNTSSAIASTSEWFSRVAQYAAEAVANAERAQAQTIERRLDRPSRHWTSAEVVRTYRANADGERRFREEADVLELRGYEGWLETEPAGHPLGARLLVGTGLGAFPGRDIWRRPRWRTVTWVRNGRAHNAQQSWAESPSDAMD